MSAQDPNFDVEAANDIRIPRRLAATKKVFEDSRGSPGMTAAQSEIAGAGSGRGNAAALGAADWLSLAPTPAFAIMALLTAVPGPPEMLCSAGRDGSPLSGMIPMYLLMSAFHSAPWLKLAMGLSQIWTPFRRRPREAEEVARHNVNRSAQRASPRGVYDSAREGCSIFVGDRSASPSESRHTCHSRRSTPGS
jgi:hypothetical protein